MALAPLSENDLEQLVVLFETLESMDSGALSRWAGFWRLRVERELNARQDGHTGADAAPPARVGLDTLRNEEAAFLATLLDNAPGSADASPTLRTWLGCLGDDAVIEARTRLAVGRHALDEAERAAAAQLADEVEQHVTGAN